MPNNQSKVKQYRRALRAFSESQMSSDSENSLDIVHSTRKGLDISQYIDGALVIYDCQYDMLTVRRTYSRANAFARCRAEFSGNR